jgi:hypothetical protein
MTDQPTTSSLENRLRRAAQRQGLALEKSKVREPRALTYRNYRLVNVATGAVALADDTTGFGLTLTEVAEALFARAALREQS